MTSQHTSLHSGADPVLVALSLIIAVIASYSAVDLAGRVAAARGAARLAWLLGGALALGGGIWAMHFTAMLVHPFPAPVGYDLPTVALSLLIAIVAAAPALQFSGGASLTWPRLLAGGALVGAGIGAMHYTGMAALRQVALTYDPALVALSIGIALVAATVALRVAFALRAVSGAPALPRKLAAASLLGVAISGMHYTGMAATSFAPLASGEAALGLQAAALPLGVGIAVVTILTLGLTLSMGLLDRRLAQQSRARTRAEQQYQSLFTHHPDAIFALDRDNACQSLNPAAAALLGRAADTALGQDLLALAPDSERPALRAALARVRDGEAAEGALSWPGPAGEPRSLRVTYVPSIVGDEVTGSYLIAYDETARYAAEAAERASAAALAVSQAAQQQLRDTIVAMDTPILPVAEGVLVVPLVGGLDAGRVDQLLERTLARVEASRARTVLLDVTGVPLLDTAAATGLLRLGRALRLLGAHCTVVGLGTEAAQALVQLGADLDALDTRRDLQDGIRAALQARRQRGAASPA